ncbi:MAG: PqqD family protein [Armatimonadetes bacterium]|nr:PqqD family protein [Armatimonadota bacterium]
MNEPVAKSEKIAVHGREEECYVLELGGMMLHHLGDVETFIWNSIDGCRTGTNLAEMVVAQYEVAPERAAEDVSRFIGELRLAGLIRSSGAEAE